MIANILTITFFMVIALLYSKRIIQIFKKRAIEKKILESKEQMVLVEFRDFKIPMRKEELPAWEMMNRRQKSDHYNRLKTDVLKRRLFKMPDGHLIPWEQAEALGLTD